MALNTVVTVLGADRTGIIAGVCTTPVSYTHLTLPTKA